MLRVVPLLATVGVALGASTGGDAGAALTASAVEDAVEVVFLSVTHKGGNMEHVHRLVNHIKASSSLPLRTHLVSDVPPTVDVSSWATVHLLSDMPEDAKAMHQNFTNLTHGPGAVYMWKPLLHRLLPMRRALVLDSDILLAGDIAQLWREMDSFDEGTVLGLAQEQAPTYTDLKKGGVNGGVQLLNLEGMRRKGAPYDIELQRCANGEYGHIGYLGDQSYYSVMRDRHPHIFHNIPCGWNRQLSEHYYHAPDFKEKHACPGQCALIHANQPIFKRIIFRLQGETQKKGLTCKQCREVLDSERPHHWKPFFPGDRWEHGLSWTFGLEHMSEVLIQCCCNSAHAGGTQTLGTTSVEGIVPSASLLEGGPSYAKS